MYTLRTISIMITAIAMKSGKNSVLTNVKPRYFTLDC